MGACKSKANQTAPQQQPNMMGSVGFQNAPIDGVNAYTTAQPMASNQFPQSGSVMPAPLGDAPGLKQTGPEDYFTGKYYDTLEEAQAAAARFNGVEATPLDGPLVADVEPEPLDDGKKKKAKKSTKDKKKGAKKDKKKKSKAKKSKKSKKSTKDKKK